MTFRLREVKGGEIVGPVWHGHWRHIAARTSRRLRQRFLSQRNGANAVVNVKVVPADALDKEWALVHADDAAYLLIREGCLCPRVLRESWTAWERLGLRAAA